MGANLTPIITDEPCPLCGLPLELRLTMEHTAQATFVSVKIAAREFVCVRCGEVLS